MTKVGCPPGSLDTRVAHELDSVRRYTIQGDRLILTMMADGGNQVWARAAN